MTQKNGNIQYPYARLKAMGQIMEFINKPKWRPEVIDVELLQLLNIASSKEHVLLGSLKFLGVINSKGEPTELFDALKTEYSGTLRRIIEDKYSDVFKLIPEELIDQTRIVNFFMSRAGTKKDTAEYQGMIFGWLCRQAGIPVPLLPESFIRARFEKLQK